MVGRTVLVSREGSGTRNFARSQKKVLFCKLLVLAKKSLVAIKRQTNQKEIHKKVTKQKASRRTE
jgi:hypothetical protein